MASPNKTSSTPKRVPLGTLNVNTPPKAKGPASQAQNTNLKISLTETTMSPNKNHDSQNPPQPRPLHPLSGQALASQYPVSQAVRQQTPLVRKKRHLDVFDSVDAVSCKRRSSGVEEGTGLVSDEQLDVGRCEEEEGGDVGCRVKECLRQTSVLVPHPDDAVFARYAQSPASSCGSGEDSMRHDDSQDTIMTMPDDVAVLATLAVPATRPATSSMSKEEIRDQANTLRLRLQLASYKVNTDQIDTPLDRLQVRTIAEMHTLPKLLRSKSPFRTSFPQKEMANARTRANNIPDINIQRASSSTHEAQSQIPSSPPNSTLESPSLENEESNRVEFATPLPPRQRDRLGLSSKTRSGSPGWDDGRAGNDLTSSVVKGRAADGLLSLSKS